MRLIPTIISGATPVWTTYEYDALGRTVKVTPPGNAGFTTYVYAGNTVTVTDAAGKWKKYETDAFGNLVKVWEPNPAGGADLITTYAYNGYSQLTQVTMTRGATTPAAVIAFVSISGTGSIQLNTAQISVAFVSRGIVAGSGDIANLQQCVDSNPGMSGPQSGASAFTLSVAEGFAASFNRRNYVKSADPGVSPSPQAQNLPGFSYHTESGFYNLPLTNAAGLADFGARIKVRFENVGNGVTLYVPTVVPLRATGNPGVQSGTLRLLNTSNGGSSAFSPSAATALVDGSPAAPISATGGVAIAVYEVLDSNESAIEAATIPVAVSYTADTSVQVPSLGVTTAQISFAPNSTVITADATSPIPRFVESGTANPVFNISSCACDLLFPFVTNQGGFDTGISIANTSRDSFGTPSQEGTVTLNYYGAGPGGDPAPAPQVTEKVPAGKSLIFNVSSGGNLGVVGTPGFQGYIIVRANFQYCHGVATLMNLNSGGLAIGYQGLVLSAPSPSRTGSASESVRK